VARNVSLEVSAAGRRSLQVVLPLAEECDKFQVEASSKWRLAFLLVVFALPVLSANTSLDRSIVYLLFPVAALLSFAALWVPGLAKIKLRPIIKWRRSTERPV
jgi:hypothetical protein